MRLAAKSTLAALAIFLVLLGGFALWTEYQLRVMASTLMEGTARLLGSEIAAVISESALEQLLQADSTAHERLEQIVADLTSHSEVVASITVVDATGQVVASKDIEAGRQLAIPEVIFEGDRHVRFLSSAGPLERGQYHLFVPLSQQDRLVGYLRLSLSSDRIAQLYRRAEHQLLFIAIAGLILVGALGLIVETQFSRVGGALTRALEAAARGEVVPLHADRNEFSQALETARKIGKELSASREQTADAQRRFGALMKVVEVGVVLISPENTLDFANESARELLGAPATGQLEQGPIKPLLDKAVTAGRMGRARADLEIARDGRTSRVRLELYQLEEGDCSGWLILVKSRDILDALENELRLAIQMRGFAQFYMAAVHDLKAPLNAIVLNLELLKNTLSNEVERGAEETRERQGRYIKVLVEEVSRLDRCLRTILTQAAPPSASREQFDLRELVDDLATLLGPQAKQQRVSLTLDVPERPIVLTGHKDRLKQALLNIAINALESMPHGGQMRIQVAHSDHRASISVRDSGPGIPPELLGEIYQMHFTTKDGGTGIGLYVARSVVESHGGEIHVESELARGTCFHVDLPIVAE